MSSFHDHTEQMPTESPREHTWNAYAYHAGRRVYVGHAPSANLARQLLPDPNAGEVRWGLRGGVIRFT